MFTQSLLRLELLSLELCSKTEKLMNTLQDTNQKHDSKSVDDSLAQLKNQEREIVNCGTRLIQFIEGCSSLEEQDKNTNEDDSVKTSSKIPDTAQADALPKARNCQDLSAASDNTLFGPTYCVNSFSDSGIDVTEEEKEESLFRAQDKMNGVSVLPNGTEHALQSVQALRQTLRNLKRTTDKAVVEFLIRSRDVLHDEMKNQSDIEHDQKLLYLISDLLTHKQDADKELTEVEFSCHEGSSLSVLEKSLCYVLVDKALLNCLLILDKAFVEGKLTDFGLELQYNTTSPGKVITEFSQAIDEKRQFDKMREDVQKNEKLVEKMRGQIRELTNEKLRLENENKGLEEKSHLWMLKSEELEMQNSVIDEERQLLKEKVCFLDESMAELQSCTEHLRQQLQTLGRQEEEARIEKDLLKEQLQSYKDEQRQYVECMTDKHEEAAHKSRNKPLVYQTKLSYNEASVVGSSASQVPCSQTIQESNMGRTENTRVGNSAFEKQRKDFKLENLSSDQDNMMKRIETLTNENDELRSKVLTLEHADNELQKKMAAVTQDHRGAIEGKEEEIRTAKEQSKVFQEDLEEKVTEVVLLQAQVLEMEKTRNNAQKEIRKMEKELPSTKGARNTDIFLPRHEGISENIHPLVKQVKGAGGDETDNVEGLSTNVSNLRQQFQSLNRALLDKEQTIRWLHERLSESEHRVLEMTALLEDLAKRKEILVNKLEMMGAVTVVRNECDIPDGYQEAVDGILRSQCSTIEKGVLAMVREAEAKQNERKVMEEECKRLEYNTEALETENLLLKVQVSDLSQSVEELEEDIIYMKCGGKDGNRPSKRLGSPKSGGSGGHRVTFDSDVDLEKREGEKLGALIENAKRRCVTLERQIRSNTSLLKATQHQNETLSRAREELQRQNCHLRRCVVDFQQTNKILHIKVVSLESRLKVVDERKSLDEMEKQSLEDRLKVMEGKMTYLKEKKKSLKKSVVEALQGEPNSSDKAHLMAKSQSEGLEVVDDVFAERTNFRNEMERLKNKVKHQSAHSRILKCEIFEFLDDVRCLESELRCAVDSVESADHEWSPLDQTKIVSTWKDEASLCQQEGMAAIMTEILELLKTAIQQLQRISHNAPLSTTDSVDARDATTKRQTLLRKQFQEDTEKLRNEKRCIQREVLAMKDVFEHLLDNSDSPEVGNKAREEERSQELKKQVLFYVETNSQMEGDVLDHLKQQSALKEELRNLKENILNLKVEKEVLLSLNDSVGSQCLAHSCTKSCDKITRNFCFVKHHGNGLESPEVFRMESDHDSEDVFGCPSDEGVCHNVCHSPDREASSCDSGYHSGRYDEGHSVHMSDKGDTAHHNRYVSTDHPVRPSLGSFYENIEREQKRSEMASILTPEKKPKGILKKRVVTEDKETASSLLKVAEDGSNGTDASSCKVCNFSDLFKPFKRTTLENEH